jgi:predicted pyridoxine 5'-phosphate oxidase superfamily flavin-nucleotide-binding protein
MSADREFPSDIAFTDTVKAIQEKSGSRSAYARMEQGQGWQTTVTPDLAFFLSDKDMFYLGTANAEGQPYIQYRGGAPGFLKVIDDKTRGPSPRSDATGPLSHSKRFRHRLLGAVGRTGGFVFPILSGTSRRPPNPADT